MAAQYNDEIGDMPDDPAERVVAIREKIERVLATGPTSLIVFFNGGEAGGALLIGPEVELMALHTIGTELMGEQLREMIAARQSPRPAKPH